MTQSVAILGRQPALGIAELESLFGADKLTLAGPVAVIANIDPGKFNFDRLGGTIKLGKLLTTLDTTEWPVITNWLIKTVPEQLQYLPEGKLQLGISLYGPGVNAARINASGLELKKIIRSAGRSVRLIPNKTPELNSAQVLHNHLTGPLGWEFLFIRDGNRTHVAQTLAVQDINAYAARDQARPKRDARVGMLPPKLAQIIINLAANQHQIKNVLDPFCGTGVLIQEALLMGYEGYGADIDNRMGEYYRENMNWLYTVRPDVSSASWQLADAAKATWETSKINIRLNEAISVPLNFDTVATETYLGRPFSALPAPDILADVVQDVNTIHKKFLQNVARQTKPGFRMCVAVPAWKTKNGFKHLPILDQLTDLGYTRISFAHASSRDLIYHRPEQIVARELVVLIRK